VTDPVDGLAAELLDQEAWTEAVTAAGQAGLVSVTPDGQIEWINRVGAMLASKTPTECVGLPIDALIPAFPPGGAAVVDADGPAPETFEAWMVRKDRMTVPIRLSVVRVQRAGRTVLVGGFHSIRRVRQMRLQLAQADRLASLGVLAAGVAHEINNPLTYVLSNLVDIGRALGSKEVEERDRPELGRLAAQALDGARRIRKIAAGLTTFARVDRGEAGPVEVVSVLEDAMRLADSQIRPRAHIIPEIDDVSPVRGTSARLAQVFLNLLLNAAQSIEPGDRANQSITVGVHADGDEVRVSIQDTGSGIPPADLDRLFEPFFTTKGRDAGSGLRLSICQQIVHGFGGRIEVQSTVGVGTTMTVVLPAEAQPVEASELAPPRSERAGRLMVVDDDPAVLDAFRRLLQVGGHEVVAVGSGAHAIALLEEDDGFDLILTDLMMDGMSGIQLYERLRVMSPRLAEKLTFVSGGAFDQRTREFLQSVSNPQLTKPFELDALLEFVADQLEKGSDS
jgi:signal transduction histidine kinase/CheY-like chemotaxis protein